MHKNGNNKTIQNFGSKTSSKCHLVDRREWENKSTIKITEMKTGDRSLELAHDSFMVHICVGSLEPELCFHSMTEVILSYLVFGNYHHENDTLMKIKCTFITGHITTPTYHNLSQIRLGLEVK
jgi:hypothetical protein